MTTKEEIVISLKKLSSIKFHINWSIPNKRNFIIILQTSVLIYVLYFDLENMKILTFHNPQNTHN